MSPDELTQLLRNLIQRETEELRREVVLLRQDLALSRRVVTTSQATAFFDEYVKPGSLVGYIKYQGLPARKTGCLWHLYVQDIFRLADRADRACFDQKTGDQQYRCTETPT